MKKIIVFLSILLLVIGCGNTEDLSVPIFDEVTYEFHGKSEHFSFKTGKVHFCGTQTTNQAFVVLKNGERCIFEVEKSRASLYKNLVNFKEIVSTKNSSVLIGCTKENRKILLEKYNIKL